MLSFRQFIDNEYKDVSTLDIITESLINKHSTHIEDLVFSKQKKGLDDSCAGLEFIIDSIGKQTVNKAVSTKIDGCVHGDTLVLTTGGHKKISQLTNNDFVASYNVDLRRIEFYTNSIPRITGVNMKDWIEVTIHKPGHTIKTTVDHQFLMSDLTYQPAHTLNKRTILYDIDNHHNKGVIETKRLDERYEQWDLTTPNNNFVVLVGESYIVVHNSPAVFLVNGDDGIGIATKSIFNKNAKINYNPIDITNNHTGELATTLRSALQYLKPIVPENEKNTIYQGDLLFTEKTKKHFNKDGVRYVGFQPNTILYSVDENSDIGKEINKSKIGLAIHTKYDWDGKDPSSMEVSEFGISKDELKQNSNVFLIDTVSNLSSSKHKIPFSVAEYQHLNTMLTSIRKLGDSINWSILDEKLGSNLMTFVNSYIRKGIKFPDSEKMYDNFVEWIEELSTKDEESKKTIRGKENARKRYDPLRELSKEKNTLIQLFDVFRRLSDVKLMVIQKLNQLSLYHNFIVKNNGDMEITGEEGFVVTQTSAKGAKLVDRLSFSKNNFSKDIIKGWSKDS